MCSESIQIDSSFLLQSQDVCLFFIQTNIYNQIFAQTLLWR